MRRIIFNQKGGVGKSSIAVNLAAIAAHLGIKTLLIDLDPQCNSSQYILGERATYGQNNPVLEPNIATFFEDTLSPGQSKGLIGNVTAILKTKTSLIHSIIHPTAYKNLFVIPASPALGEMEHALQSKHKIFKLRDALHELEGEYGLIFIDTPPAFNFFTLSALIAVHKVIIPFDCDVFSKRALQTLLENVAEARADHNSILQVEGVIVNQFLTRASLPQQVVDELISEGLPVFDSKLPSSVIMKESHLKNKPLIHLAPDHKLTQAYVALFHELEPKRKR